MSKNLTIANHDLTVKEYKGHRVITFKDIDMLHERPADTAHRNFKTNKERFIEGTDYFHLTFEELWETKFVQRPNSQGLTVITESGYLMLVKSLTDDLAWQVQRELVNNYFRVKEESKPKADNSDKQERLEIYKKNVQARRADLLTKIANSEAVGENYKKILLAHAAKELTGDFILPLPVAERKTYSATEIGQMFGKSSNLIGRLANEYKLKTDEYGQLYHDKSRYSAKEVDSFRYYDTVIPKFKALLGNGGNA